MDKCKVCGEKTKSVFNIKFKAVLICENCSNSIFLQQAVWFGKGGDREFLKEQLQDILTEKTYTKDNLMKIINEVLND
jgi:tRNA G26 N,N-dimethylase Trm1